MCMFFRLSVYHIGFASFDTRDGKISAFPILEFGLASLISLERSDQSIRIYNSGIIFGILLFQRIVKKMVLKSSRFQVKTNCRIWIKIVRSLC